MTCALLYAWFHFAVFGCPAVKHPPTPQPRICIAGPCLVERRTRRRD